MNSISYNTAIGLGIAFAGFIGVMVYVCESLGLWSVWNNFLLDKGGGDIVEFSRFVDTT